MKEMPVQQQDKLKDKVMRRWLSGQSLVQIQASESLSYDSVVGYLNSRRKELREFQEQDIHELAAERIEGLRLIQADAVYYQGLFPKSAASLLTVRLRAEESIAKIQGVLNDKVVHLGKITHLVKMYDFEDNFPDLVVEGNSHLIEEPTLQHEEPEDAVLAIESAAVVDIKVTANIPLDRKNATIITDWA